MCKIQQQLFCSEIVTRAPSILESGEWADCKFVVGVEPHQVVVVGYKLVMALASPVFEAMFYGSLAETSDHVSVVDVEPEIFKAMLQYMYSGNINISSCHEACQLYYAAKKYMLKHLMELCSKYVQTTLNVGNVCQIYEYSLFLEDDALAQECKKMFSEHTGDLLKSSSFAAAELGTVATIFSLDILDLDSELDLIEAAAQYAEVQDINNKEETSSVSSTSLNEIDKQLTCGPSKLKFDTTEKQQIRSAVRNIRFLNLTPQEYVNCAARYSLLTLPEDHAVLMNIASEKSDVPMPSGFSTSRVNRVSKTSFYSKIVGYCGHTITSQKHNFQRLMWQLKVSPYGQYRTIDSIRFSLVCTNENQSSSWSCDVTAELRIISHRSGVEPCILNIQRVFSEQQSEGLTRPILWKDFSDYIKDSIIEVEVHIKANKGKKV